jgi:hypothetical protein
MKAFKNPNENSSIGWPHPSLCGEVVESRLRVERIQASTVFNDEHNQTGILTSASDRFPPSRFLGGIGICSRYSGATVPDFHRVP